MGRQWTEDEIINRIIDSVSVDEGGCWIYKNGTIQHGPYRKVYVYYRGVIPDGLHLDHLCSYHPCINPYHLEPVTPGENRRRAYQEKRQAKTPLPAVGR